MKKNLKYFAIALATVFASACSVSDLKVEEGSKEVTIDASFASESGKSILQEDNSVFWENGDAINVFCAGENSRFVTDIATPAATCKFTGSLNVVVGMDEGLTGNNAINVLYPYNSKASIKDGAISTTLSGEQVGKAGSFAKDTYVAIGTSENFQVGFYAVCGGVRFSLTRDDITRVTFKSVAGEAVAGKFTTAFDESTNVPVVKSVELVEDVITLTAPDGGCFEAGKYYYIVTLPATLEKGFQMEFKTSGNKVATYTDSKSVTIKRKTFGSLAEIDKNLEFTDYVPSWTRKVIDFHPTIMTMEIDPVTDMPVIATVEYAGTSAGPVTMFYGLSGTPVVASAPGQVCQYLAFGISPSGKKYVYSQDKTAKKGFILSSSDGTTWAKEIEGIDLTNSYNGRNIAFIGNEIFAATSNNAAAGAIGKRGANLTCYNGSVWSTGNPLMDRPSSWYAYYPTLVTKGDAMYCFVTNMAAPTGLSIYKYASKVWSEVITINASEPSFAPYVFGSYLQDMCVTPDGKIYIAIGATGAGNYGVAVICIDPSETKPEDRLYVVADKITLTDSIASRYSRLAIASDGTLYFAYRNDNQYLFVTTLNEDKWEWNTPVQLTSSKTTDDIIVRCDSKGKPYVAAALDNVIQIFTLE